MADRVYVLKSWDRSAFTSRPMFWSGVKRGGRPKSKEKIQSKITKSVVKNLKQLEMGL